METSAAINDKVDDLLAGTLKQIRLSEQKRSEQRRRLTVTNDIGEVTDFETDRPTSASMRKASAVPSRGSKNVFSKFFSVFKKKPARFPTDVENLNTDVR